MSPRILVTAATGQLGRLVVEALLAKAPAASIVAAVRSPDKAADLAALGVELRAADYSKPETLGPALAGIDRVLLISSSEIGQRTAQHANVIDAAVKAGVKRLAYTSILHADTSPLGLAAEHVATEKRIVASGLPYVFLRNSWYLENYNANIQPAIAHGAVFGAAGEGRIAAASRADYAAAAAEVLTADAPASVYELAGDEAFTMATWAATLAEVSAKPVVYRDMLQADYAALLVQIGLPAPFADLLADSDVGASKGGLFDDSHTLSKLIGRPTTPLKSALAAALKG